MAPIGEPINVTGVRPIFRKPEPIVPNLPIQVPPKEFIQEPEPPRSGIPNVGGTIENPILRDLPEPPKQITKPPIGRPIPPISIGGIGGIGAINPIKIGQPVPSPIDIPAPILPDPSGGTILPPSIGTPKLIDIPIDPGRRFQGPIDAPDPMNQEAFFQKYPDAPRPPDVMTMDMTPYTDPITGVQTIGSSSMASYRGQLNDFLQNNPQARTEFLKNRIMPVRQSAPGSFEIGQIRPVLPTIGGSMPDPRAGRPRGPIVGGMVPGGGGIDYGGGEGPPLLPDLTIGRGGGLIPPPKQDRFIPPEDFGFGPGVRPSEIRDKFGNVVAGPMGKTPPMFEEYRKSPIQESFADFLARIGAQPDGTPPTISIPEDVFDDRPGQIFVPPTDPLVEPVRTPDAGIVPPPSVIQPPLVPIADPIVEPAPTTPAAVAPDVGAVTDATMAMGAIDPVLLQQATAETLTDPLIRSLYFGTQDSPGFFQQLQQAGANLIGQDVPLQQTAGLTPLELLARQQAVAGLGGFEPFLQQNRNLVNQAIAQSRRAEQLQDPYYTQAEQIYQDTMGAYDPSMTQQFFNPFEDAVVQQTISDVLEAGEQQDIAARAREIGAGAFGGSRARLGAMERREALGEGLAQALGRIRQQGFSEAQRTGLGEFARQQQAKRTGAQGLIGIGTGRGSAAGNLAQRLAGFGGQMTDLGVTQEQLRSGQRGELAGFGATGRGIEETGLGRIYEQQIGQQFRPLQTLGQIGSMLPGYQASQTQIDSQYGMPTDPTAAGLGAAFSAYGALAPRQGSS